VVFIFLAAADGGYFERAYLPAGVGALALLCTALVSIRTRAAMPRPVAAAAWLLAAYAGWSYLSILWAGDAGAALEAANRSLLYAIAFALFALWPMRSASATAILGTFALGVAGLGLVTLLGAVSATDVTDRFAYGRFLAPVGYANGAAALWFMALIPAVFLAARREVPAPVRGLALGGAGLLAALALLGQSRGWLVTMPFAIALFLAIAPGRARHGMALVAVVGGVVLTLDPVLGVFRDVQEGGDPAAALDAAARAILAMAGVLVVVGTVAALVDRRARVGRRTAGRIRLATGSALALTAVALAAVAIVGLGDPVARAGAAWDQLTSPSDSSEQPSGGARFTSLGGQNRVDYWRVALGQLDGRLLHGAGAGNFQDAYLREGQSSERPQSPHSVIVGAISQTGLVGALLLFGGIAAALLAAAGTIRGASPWAASTAGTSVAVFGYFLLHGSIDWLYELPALAAPAFAMLGLAAAVAPRRRLERPDGVRSGAIVRGPLRVAALIVATTAAVVALGAPYLAAREVDRAAETWQTQPTAALERLDRAAALNPLSIDPHTTAAAIAIQLDLTRVAQQELREVLDRSPASAYSTLQLGALESELGRPVDAMLLLVRAAELSPRDELIRSAISDVAMGKSLDAGRIYDQAVERRRAIAGQ
jgi:hypothetical protein